jgi:single-strand DNA-binding protein
MPRKPAATAEAPTPPAAPEQRRHTGPALNRVELIGRLAAAPELRFTPSGLAVCTLRVATNVGDTAEYHDVTAWGTLAETCAQYLARGRLVYVDGHLHTEKWERDDVPQRRTVIVAGTVRFLDRPDGTGAPAPAPATAVADGEQ